MTMNSMLRAAPDHTWGMPNLTIPDISLWPGLYLQAEEDGVACVENIAGKAGHVNYNTVPSIVYTHPEVASVGRTEEQVKADGIEYQVLHCSLRCK